MQHIATMKGDGTVKAGNGQQVPVHYEVRVYEQKISLTTYDDPRVPPIWDSREIHGRVAPVCFVGETVVLQMKDGHACKFSFRDMQGGIVFGGWID